MAIRAMCKYFTLLTLALTPTYSSPGILRVLTCSHKTMAEVNLYGIAARYIVTVVSKKDMGIVAQFPHCNYTVGPYGSRPTATYLVPTCT